MISGNDEATDFKPALAIQSQNLRLHQDLSILDIYYDYETL